RVRPRPPVADIEKRDLAAVDAVAAVRRAERDQPGRIVERQRANGHRVDDAEDGAVDADSQRQAHDGERGTPRVLDEGPAGVAQVLEEGVHETHSNLVPTHDMRIHCELWLPRPRDEVFAFFADAANLERLTPPWLHFHIINPDIVINRGALIDYRLKIHGI